jgi:peptidoglycan hydrolase FlgJ
MGDVNFTPSARPEPFDAARGGAQDKLRRGALAQPVSQRPSTTLGTSEGVDQRAQLKAAAKAFEAVFLRQMIGSMRSAKLAEDELTGGGNAADTFRDLQDSKLADSMAGQFGIAELLEKQFGGLRK